MTEQAILVIGRFSSHCGNCGKGAAPYEIKHETVLGYGVSGKEIGCGVAWTHVTSEYIGQDHLVAKMRPDLELIPIEFVPPFEHRGI